MINSIKTAITNGLLVFNGYMGLAVTLRAARLMSTGRLSGMNLATLLSEDNLKGRVGWVRSGLFVAGLSGLYKLVSGCLQLSRMHDDGWNDFVGGAVAGSSILFLDRDQQRTYAMYAFARVAFCLYNAAKTRGWWKIGGVDYDNLGECPPGWCHTAGSVNCD
jgi:hypothetical protein